MRGITAQGLRVRVVEEMADGDERQLKCEAACAIQCLQVCASG
jgi:hypothetical protein